MLRTTSLSFFVLSLIACGSSESAPPEIIAPPPEEAPAAAADAPPPAASPAPLETAPAATPPPPALCTDQSATFEPSRPRTNVVFLLDRSGSMHLRLPSSTRTRWAATRDTLFSVVEKLPALQMRASVAMFPQGDDPISCCKVTPANTLDCNACTSSMLPPPNDRCAASSYAIPLPKDVDATTTAAMKAYVNESNDDFYWGTPLAAALNAAVLAQKGSTNDGIDSIVLLTDGEPTSCVTNDVSDVVEAAKLGMTGTKKVRTFVLGIIDGTTGAQTESLNQIAAAGGTKSAYTVQASAFTTGLTSALDKIARDATDCTFDLPPAKADADLEKTNVTLDRIGGPQTLNRDPKHTQGWDFISNGTQIKLYGDACKVVREDAKAKVTVVVGCKTVT